MIKLSSHSTYDDESPLSPAAGAGRLLHNGRGLRDGGDLWWVQGRRQGLHPVPPLWSESDPADRDPAETSLPPGKHKKK